MEDKAVTISRGQGPSPSRPSTPRWWQRILARVGRNSCAMTRIRAGNLPGLTRLATSPLQEKGHPIEGRPFQ
jgi:hypothetical protein